MRHSKLVRRFLVTFGMVLWLGLARLGADEIPGPTLELLKTFNEEFIVVTPGSGMFPDSFLM